MLYRKIILLLSILSISITSISCGKNNTNSADGDSIEITSEEALLQTAFDIFNSSDKRATTTVYTTTYEDGTTRSETEEIIYHSSESIIEKRHTTQEEIQTSLYVKDGTNLYCYEDDNSYSEEWVKYVVTPDENGDTSFDYILAEFDYSFNEAGGYTDVIIKNEGNETLNNKDTVKLTVTANFSPSEEDTEPEPNNKKSKNSVTRKDLLKEFEWTEESVQAVDGFSEILDRYIAYLNEEGVMNANVDDSNMQYTIWIDSESACITQLQTTFSAENATEENTSDIENEFWDNVWKVDWIQYDINDGLSVEEAKELLEIEMEYIEEQMEYEDSLAPDDEDISESGSRASEVTYTKTFLIDEDCPTMTKVPSLFFETTYEDYYSTLDDYEE